MLAPTTSTGQRPRLTATPGLPITPYTPVGARTQRYKVPTWRCWRASGDVFTRPAKTDPSTPWLAST